MAIQKEATDVLVELTKTLKTKFKHLCGIGYTPAHRLIDHHIEAFRDHMAKLKTLDDELATSNSTTTAIMYEKISHVVKDAEERLEQATLAYEKFAGTPKGMEDKSNADGYLSIMQTTLKNQRSHLNETKRLLQSIKVRREYIKHLEDFDDNIEKIENRISKAKRADQKLKRRGSIDTMLENARISLQKAEEVVDNAPRGVINDRDSLNTNLDSKARKLREVKNKRKDQSSRICTIL